MQVFVRVAEAGSFSRAATSLGLANSSVTSCVSNLERHLGVTLLHRNSRHIRLTEEGKKFLPQCEAILLAVSNAEASVLTQIEKIAGTVRVEVPVSLGRTMICPALSEFARLYPQISVAVTLTNQQHDIVERAIDVAIRTDTVEDGDLVARPIYAAKYVVCCSPAVAKQLSPDPADLDSSRCLGLLREEQINQVDWQLSKEDRYVTLTPSGPLHFSSSDALAIAAVKGDGIVCVLDIFVNRYIKSGELVEVFSDWTLPRKNFYAVTTKTRVTSKKVRLFIEFLQTTLGRERRPDVSRTINIQSLNKRPSAKLAAL
jgi:LysR family transcriptional regulator for bpeEF and oprC